MSFENKRSFQAGRNFQRKQSNQPTRTPRTQLPTSTRQGIARNLPQSSIRQRIGQTTRRMQKIKSPFDNDQTRTITNKADPTKKRKLGQIPLRDRTALKRKKLQPRPQPQQQTQVQFGQKKKTKPKPKAKPKSRNQFNRKNKSQEDIDQIFKFDSNRSFF